MRLLRTVFYQHRCCLGLLLLGNGDKTQTKPVRSRKMRTSLAIISDISEPIKQFSTRLQIKNNHWRTIKVLIIKQEHHRHITRQEMKTKRRLKRSSWAKSSRRARKGLNMRNKILTRRFFCVFLFDDLWVAFSARVHAHETTGPTTEKTLFYVSIKELWFLYRIRE